MRAMNEMMQSHILFEKNVDLDENNNQLSIHNQNLNMNRTAKGRN